MKRITIYIRKLDGIHVIPDGFTAEEGHYQIDPFEHLLLKATADEIWRTVETAM